MKRTGFWAHVDPKGTAIAQTIDTWEKRKDRFFVTPTLVVHEAVAESYDKTHPRFTEHPDTRLVSPAMLAAWKRRSPPTQWGELSEEEIAEAKASVEGRVSFVRLAHARGIWILSGTDSPVLRLLPGVSLHRE